MIEQARGNSAYRVGADTYKDWEGGAQPIDGASTSELNVSAARIADEIKAGNPVILKGTSSKIPSHFLLAVGVKADGSIVVLDPAGGKTLTVSPDDWKTNNSSASVTIAKMRLIDL